MQIKSMWFVLSLVVAYGGGLGTGIVVVHTPSTEDTVKAAVIDCPPAAVSPEPWSNNKFHNSEIEHGKSKGF
jgi:hypothetical protein